MAARDGLIDYLIAAAVGSYNNQFNTNFATSDFTLMKIATEINWTIGYEVIDNNNPNFRLRVYSNVGPYDSLSSFMQEVDNSYVIDKLGDEVMVAYGTLSVSRIKNMGFNIKQWGIDSSVDNVFLTEDFNFIMTEDGQNLAL